MFTIYSKEQCNYCVQSKRLLDAKKHQYVVKMLDVDYTLDELKELVPNVKSFPVVFKDDKFIGSFAELRLNV